jgi:hypothetical protein
MPVTWRLATPVNPTMAMLVLDDVLGQEFEDGGKHAAHRVGHKAPEELLARGLLAG